MRQSCRIVECDWEILYAAEKVVFFSHTHLYVCMYVFTLECLINEL